MATETVTVVFTDLVGSTALMSRVGEARAEQLRQEHMGLLRAEVGSGGGREVKNLGDGLMVVFAGAADAVETAVAMQQRLERRNRRAPEALEIRVGIAAGDTDVEDGDHFGAPVVQAARLCAAAEGGEILCSEVVRLLGGSRAAVAFEVVGDLELKGLAEPVSAHRVAWAPLAADVHPVPGRLAAAASVGFVGREAEHQSLREAWKAAAADADRRVVLVAGEPGMGKTSLAAQVAGEAHDEGAIVLYGRSDEDLAIPYQPWIEALTHLVELAPEPVLVDHVHERGAHLARLVPKVAARVGVEVPAAGDGDSDRLAVFAAIADLLERVSAETPVLLVLDDLHWADRQSLQLLRHVATAGRALRLLVVGTFRDTDVARGDAMTELLAALHREQGCERVSLRGLSHADLLVLLESVAGHQMDDSGLGLRDALLAETAGNPFFVGEILRHLAETGAIYRDDEGHWVGDLDVRTVGLPVSVKEVVGRRLTGLGPDTERLLTQAAVIGRDFEVGLLASVAGVDEDTVIDVCDAAVAAAVLQETDRIGWYTFAHALIEHTLYEGLSPTRRARTHRAVAETIERVAAADLDARAGELALHWSAAADPKALHYASLAGERALDQLAPDDALHWFGRALELIDRNPAPDPRRRAETLLGLGVAQRQTGRAEHNETLLAAARLADDIDAVDLLVRAALANSRGFNSNTGARDDARLEVLDRALDRAGTEDSPERAQLLALAGIERYYMAALEERVALAEETVAVARRCCSPAELLSVLHGAAWALRGPVTMERNLQLAVEAAELAATVGDPVLTLQCEGELLVAALNRADRESWERHRAGWERLGARISEGSVRWSGLFTAASTAILEDDLATAEQKAEDALELGLAIGAPDAFTLYGAQLVNIRFHQGRGAETADLIVAALDDAPYLGVYRAVLAHALGLSGDRDRATRLLEEDMADGFRTRSDSSTTTTLAAWSDAAVALGHRAAAERLHVELRPFAALMCTTSITFLPVGAHYLGRLDHLLGRLDDADRWFAEADRIHRDFGSPLFCAYSDIGWAAMLVDRNRGDDRHRARALAERSLSAAVPNGYGALEAQARAVLEAVGD